MVVSILLAACSPVAGETPVPTPTLPPTIIPIVTTVEGEATGEEDEPGASEQAQATSTEERAPTQTPLPQAHEGESCLYGSWSVVHESLIGYLTEAFDQSGQITFEFQAGQGDLILTFDGGGTTTFFADNLEISVTVPGLADFNFIVEGYGLARFEANEEVIATWGHTSTLTSAGGGEVEGRTTEATAEILLTPEMVFIESTSDHTTHTFVDVPEDARFTLYECSGNNLILNVDGTLTSEWVRVIGNE
jgi:hypothetical protein